MTQRMQLHFPVGVIPPEVINQWNGCAKELIANALIGMLSRGPGTIISSKPEPLLDPVGACVVLRATTDRFIAREKFVINTKNDAPVKISYLGDNFKEWFLGKVEEPKGASTLRPHLLKKSSLDGPIIAELGGEAKAETTLAEIYEAMELQRSGEDGVLLTNGRANIFYVRDKRLLLCAVDVRWSDDGWHVLALSIKYPAGWLDGRHVFSCNS